MFDEEDDLILEYSDYVKWKHSKWGEDVLDEVVIGDQLSWDVSLPVIDVCREFVSRALQSTVVVVKVGGDTASRVPLETVRLLYLLAINSAEGLTEGWVRRSCPQNPSHTCYRAFRRPYNYNYNINSSASSRRMFGSGYGYETAYNGAQTVLRKIRDVDSEGWRFYVGTLKWDVGWMGGGTSATPSPNCGAVSSIVDTHTPSRMQCTDQCTDQCCLYTPNTSLPARVVMKTISTSTAQLPFTTSSLPSCEEETLVYTPVSRRSVPLSTPTNCSDCNQPHEETPTDSDTTIPPFDPERNSLKFLPYPDGYLTVCAKRNCGNPTTIHYFVEVLRIVIAVLSYCISWCVHQIGCRRRRLMSPMCTDTFEDYCVGYTTEYGGYCSDENQSIEEEISNQDFTIRQTSPDEATVIEPSSEYPEYPEGNEMLEFTLYDYVTDPPINSVESSLSHRPTADPSFDQKSLNNLGVDQCPPVSQSCPKMSQKPFKSGFLGHLRDHLGGLDGSMGPIELSGDPRPTEMSQTETIPLSDDTNKPHPRKVSRRSRVRMVVYYVCCGLMGPFASLIITIGLFISTIGAVFKMLWEFWQSHSALDLSDVSLEYFSNMSRRCTISFETGFNNLSTNLSSRLSLGFGDMLGSSGIEFNGGDLGLE